MKRFIPLIIVACVVGVLAFWGGRESTKPELIEPLSHEVPGWRDMRAVQRQIYQECNIFANPDPRNDYDDRVFGASDYWQDCRINKEGDCEDYALAFKNLLIERYPAMRGRVSLYFVWVEHEGQLNGHAIAIVDHPKGDRFVFDNGFNSLKSLDQVKWRYKSKNGENAIREIQQSGTRYVFVERGNA